MRRPQQQAPQSCGCPASDPVTKFAQRLLADKFKGRVKGESSVFTRSPELFTTVLIEIAINVSVAHLPTFRRDTDG